MNIRPPLLWATLATAGVVGSPRLQEPRSDLVRSPPSSIPEVHALSVESSPSGGEQEDPRLPRELIDGLREAKLIDLLQTFGAGYYEAPSGEPQPLTDQVLIYALNRLKDSYLKLGEGVQRECVARMQMEQRLVNTEDLLQRERVYRDVDRRREQQLRQEIEAALRDLQGVKRPRVP